MSLHFLTVPTFLRNFLKLTALLLFPMLLVQCSNQQQAQSGDALKSVTLEDGTKVHLNKNSQLDYPASFGDSLRQVKLIGEGYFEIQHDANRPFVISTDGAEYVNTAGGQLNIKVSEKNIALSQQTGKSSFMPFLNTPNIEMTAGMSAEIDRKIGRRNVSKKASMNADFWRSNVIEFHETPLRMVFNDLKKLYGIQFSSASRELLDCTFTYRLNNPSLDQVLAELTNKFGITFNKRNEKTIILDGGSCANSN